MASAMHDIRPGPIPDDLLPALHEEIARLPEKYRLAVVLCDLEGLPQAEAAGAVALERADAPPSPGRGPRAAQGPPGPPRPGARRRRARGRVPPRGAGRRPAGLECTRPSARRSHTINPAIAAGTVSAAAQSLTQEVLKIMLVQKLKIASAALLGAGLMAWAASAALVSRAMSPRRRPRRRSRSGQRSRRAANPNPTRSMRSAPSRSAAACSTPTASRSPAPRSTSRHSPKSRLETRRSASRRPAGPRGGERPPTAGSTSSSTRRRATALTATSRPGTRRRSRPSPRVTGRPGSAPDRCSRAARPRSDWSATTCRSAAAWSTRRAGPSPV